MKFIKKIQGAIEDFKATNVLYNTWKWRKEKIYFVETDRGYFIFNKAYPFAKFMTQCEDMWSAGSCHTAKECEEFFQEIYVDNDKYFYEN